ncbi:MAG: SCO family protein [Bacteroidia bacterium]|nr:SCO family protein [Bacteroidia bacterium]MDW8088141.1 SCO family protein [Bacteroidia bacterium]
MRPALRIAGVLLILLLPFLLWFLLSQGKTHYRRLPILGHSTVQGSDTLWHTLPDFQLWTQDSLPFTRDSLRGRIHVANYFFTRCPGICPRLSQAMYFLQEALAGRAPQVRLVSYTVDPAHDTPAILREYAAKHRADPSRWTFVTGAESTLYRLARQGYLLYTERLPDTTKGELGLVHSDALVLVDPDLRLRGVYSGLDSMHIQKLLDDIGLLLLEYRR